MKDFDTWNSHKKEINEVGLSPEFFHVRELWWATLGLNIGHEQDGKNDEFERPVLILKKFNRHVFLGVPLSTQEKSANKYYVKISWQGNSSFVIISQIRLFSSKRLKRKLGKISGDSFLEVKNRIISDTLDES